MNTSVKAIQCELSGAFLAGLSMMDSLYSFVLPGTLCMASLGNLAIMKEHIRSKNPKQDL